MPTQILMPALSPTMEEGKLAKWHVKEGDTVKSGDILAEIETDKATMEFEAIDEGKIGKILVPEGAEGVKVNQPIAVLLGEGESAKDVNIPAAMKSVSAAIARQTEAPKLAPAKPTSIPAAPAPKTDPQPKQPTGNGQDKAGRVFASPLARRVAQKAGIDIAALTGSGPRGRIVKADVDAVVKSGRIPAAAGPATPAAEGRGVPGVTPLPDARLFYKEGEYELIPHDAIRKSIAKRLTSAKALIPHYYLTIECDIGELMAARARLNERSPKGEGAYKLSVNDFIVKAAALALMRIPEVNASWTDTEIGRAHV
jgi:pyruvate dehydrogenase E2 component (dihydrolipoamide acetyltransferase)